MKRILVLIAFLLSSNLLIAESILEYDTNLIPCFKMEEIQPIGKEINMLLKQEFCEEQVNPQKVASMSKNILAQIMTESFLGIKPPDNWQQLTNEIIEDCIKKDDLCKREARKQFELCFEAKIPFILIQFGPWIVEHCSQLNDALIQQWPNKKSILRKRINESKVQNNGR
jgi:hypothetical protein